MDFSSFLVSLGTSFVIFLVLMLVFAWLSSNPGNHVIYYPNRILKGLDPTVGSRTRSPFAWIKEALSSSEKDVISMSGVDSAVYFVFLSTVLGIFVLSAVVLLPVLIPVAATDDGIKNAKKNDTLSVGTFNELDRLSMGNVNLGSNRLWAFLLATYWVSFVAYYLTWKAYNHISALRAEALMTPEVKAEQFAIVVRDIPPVPQGQTRKEQVDSFFRKIYPDTFYRSMIVTDNKEVNKLWEELEGYKRKLERSEAAFAASKTEAKPEGTKPMHKTGFLGLIGEKVDSIEFYSQKINELVRNLESEQKTTLREKQKNAAFVFFNNRATAASAAQNLHAKIVDKWTILAAPEPRQLIWPNLYIDFIQRQVRQYVVYVIVALMIFFYMIPIGIISAITTLNNLTKLLPFLKPVVNINAIKIVLEAYLPQLALIIFLAVLPNLLLLLSKSEGIPSEGHAERAASGKYFYFTVLNVFLGVTLGGALFKTFKDIQKDPNSLVPLLASSLPGSATFFLTFVALKFFVGYGLELSRIVPLIIFHLKKKFLCKCEADVKDAWTPGDFGYGTRIPGDLLIFTIGLCYSIMTPLIIPFSVIYFGLGWLILRNQALKVYVPAYETYGRIWPHIFNRIIASLLLYQLTMFGFFGVKKFFYAPILIPLPIISLIFAFICHTKFYRAFADTALEVTCNELKEVPNMEQVFRSFVPPSLSSEKVDDDQFEDARSQASRTGSFA
ncbi:CSC1-like protein ERD4 [Cucurbita moschata]|uniref:CSC1-like protein ERD4 n=1 Tax=Cucurbita moschata TaxID=3662 RepID=A0A6J1ECU6_CUCMO|nr:CSC1-like protein ERD4 [Cucurbita moschata]